MSAPYLLTVSGLRIDLLSPRPEDVTLPDIAHALARICRYTGHVRGASYSVAQHSVLVAQYLRDQGHTAGIQAQGLMHDAHEAYTGDMASPIKRAIAAIQNEDGSLDPADDAPGFPWGPPGARPVQRLSAWQEFEHRHATAVRRRFGLPLELAAPVHAADLALLMAEKRDLMPDDDGPGWPAGAPAGVHVYPLSCNTARGLFLDEARLLGVV